MSLLEFENVSLNYYQKNGEIEALKNLSFSIDSGDFAAIVGPSGCGKTTILSIISGLITPTSGNVVYDGMDKNAVPTGYMLQRDCLFPWRNILKNATLGLEVKKEDTDLNIRYVKSLLKKYDLIDFADKYPSELSGGMRQRVALIRTLATRPKLLLLDEPTSSLDYQTRLNVCDDLYNIISSEHKTAILVTHDISEAISMANKIFVLTKRPATIKAKYSTNFPDSLSPLGRRESPEFPVLFEKIWRDLNE